MATLRDLKGRIGSVSSSEKITGAMKMISSAKMNKAVRDIKRLLPFRNQLEAIIAHLLEADAQCVSPLTEEREVSHLTVVVAGSDDGLCGAYNLNIFKELLAHVNSIRESLPSASIRLIPVGSKMVKAVGKLSMDRVEVITDAPVNSAHQRHHGGDGGVELHALDVVRHLLDALVDARLVRLGILQAVRAALRQVPHHVHRRL